MFKVGDMFKYNSETLYIIKLIKKLKDHNYMFVVIESGYEGIKPGETEDISIDVLTESYSPVYYKSPAYEEEIL